ncbi:MAG: sulfatase-like hydrolase/transferase [Planctomycetota bacterium]|nr:sulfatase-like hydrolase/transferase [Planctomycetota bacterium]
MRSPSLLVCLTLALPTLIPAQRDGDARAPNVVVVYTDDQGWADIGTQGAEGFETPHLDRLAREGVRFSDFYVSQPVCSASRASLLTGCYANRIGIHGALGPGSRNGIGDEELTLAELCKQKGHRTAAVGKWHLGHHPRFLPTRHGFDEFYGIPYSNDMWPHHPENPKAWGDLPTLDGEEVVGLNTDQNRFTGDFTKRAVAFIDRCAAEDAGFFLYVAHPMPHVPLHASDAFRGRTERGLYGDVIEEIDASVGAILDALDRHELADETLFIYASDNGPWLSYGDHAGSAGPLREGKGTTFEGGIRVPCLWRFPGRIPAGRVQSEPAMTIDVLPTVAALLDADLPDHAIDGLDIWPLVTCAPDAKSPHDALFFYYGQGNLEAMRSGPWKLHFPHGYRSMIGREPGEGGIPGKYDYGVRTGVALYHLGDDIGETTNLAERHPEIVARLEELADAARAELGDGFRKQKGAGARAPGMEPAPRKDEPEVARSAPRNLVVLLADDLGAGDLGAYNPTSKIPTPNFDRLAAEGMRFDDAHSPSSVCTPTRYALLTGRYAWRSRLKRGVLDGWGRALIEPGRATIASILADAGYDTACFGKWHLGLGAFDPERPNLRADFDVARFDTGPHTQGFQTSRIIPASLDFAPYCWVTNGALEQPLSEQTPGSKRRWDGGEGFWRAGPISPGFVFNQILPETGRDAVRFLAGRKPSDRPFLMYVPLSAPHTPWVPTDEYEGKAQAGPYGDFVAQVDATLGAILDALDAAGLADQTMVVATSDNGSHWRPEDVTHYAHDAHNGRRGMKADIHEAGHRVPFLVRGPGVRAGASTQALTGLLDIFATFCDLAGLDLAEGTAPDSVSFAATLADPKAQARDHLIHHSADGMFSIRMGPWKLIEGLGSGGFTAPKRQKPVEGGPEGQLYDLVTDPAERENRWSEEAAVRDRLRNRLSRVRGDD